MGDRRRGISPGTLVLASVGSACATFLIARFGLEGTIVGAALSPVLVALVAEAVRRPAQGIRSRAGGVQPRPRTARPARTVYKIERRPRLGFDRVSWGRVFLTGAAAFALVVAAVTLADIGLGNSVASDRDTTFFGRADTARPKPPADEPVEETPTVPADTVTPEPPPAEEEPETTTSPEEAPVETAPTETAPAETTATTP